MGFLTRVLNGESRSIENPNIPLDSDEAFELFGARKSESGVKVTHASILEYSPIYRGVSLISTMIAKVPLEILERGPDGRGKNQAKDHFAWGLLRYKPNPEMTAFTFRQTMQSHAMLWGNAFALIVRDQRGQAKELILLRPDRVQLVRFEGTLFYVISFGGDLEGAGSTQKKLTADSILHIRGLGSNGFTGHDIVKLSKTSVGSAIASERYSAFFYGNHAKTGAVIEVPGSLSDDAYKRLTRDWNRMNNRLSDAHRTAILEEGGKLKAMTIPAKDAQLIESKKHDLTAASNWTGAPIHKIGGEGRTAFKSLEEENQNFLDEGVDGWFVQWELEARDKILTEEQKAADSHLVEFKREAMVRANIVKRFAAHRIALGGAPFRTRNEVRADENLNPIEGGDEVLVPLNMKPGGDEKPEDDDKPGNGDKPDEGAPPTDGDNPDGGDPPANPDQKSLRAVAELLVVDITRALRRMKAKALKSLRKNDRKYSDLSAGVPEILGPSYRVYYAAFEVSEPFDTLEKLCENLADHFREAVDRCIKQEHSGNLIPAVEACCERMESESSRELVEIMTGITIE